MSTSSTVVLAAGTEVLLGGKGVLVDGTTVHRRPLFIDFHVW